MAALAVSQNILELDINVQPICRKASAETFIVWRQIINIKTVANQAHGTINERSSSTIEAINLSVAAVRDFSHSFQPFILHCVRNFHCLSTCPRISLGKFHSYQFPHSYFAPHCYHWYLADSLCISFPCDVLEPWHFSSR